MLVLSRKTGETIRISDKITITVVAIGNGRVKLGIVAPLELSVHRGEVHDRIMKEKPNAEANK
jgi:carbon storage regulator